MYKPKFNKVLVEINDEDAQWGTSSESNPLTQAYREGIVIEVGKIIPTADQPVGFYDEDKKIGSLVYGTVDGFTKALVSRRVMWNQGHEAGTVFEEAGKKYALIYWWDIIGEKVEA